MLPPPSRVRTAVPISTPCASDGRRFARNSMDCWPFQQQLADSGSNAR